MTGRIGAVGYATAQGLGHLHRDFVAAGIVDESLIIRHSRPANLHWFPPGTPVVNPRNYSRSPEYDAFLGKVDVVLWFETAWDWSAPVAAKQRGVKTALCPMYEWTPRRPPCWFDKVLCPSALDYDYFKPGGLAGFTMPCEVRALAIPVDPSTWKLRTEAKRFLHNAGHIGHREHKGTRQVLEAVRHVRSDLTLTVRAQHDSGIRQMMREVFGSDSHPKIDLVAGEIPRERLFADHDVYVAPEKLNGLSLPLQEARAAGMLVVTTDRYPANQWLPDWPLIPVEKFERACISSSYLELDEAVVRPEAIAGVLDSVCGMDIREYSEQGRAWAEAHSWAALKDAWREALLA
ncbi:MAG TPA: glycosyltransferase [Aquabacterium sp.]|nr:glycosyltransferase [Aquabacterium sp.]